MSRYLLTTSKLTLDNNTNTADPPKDVEDEVAILPVRMLPVKYSLSPSKRKTLKDLELPKDKVDGHENSQEISRRTNKSKPFPRIRPLLLFLSRNNPIVSR